MAHTHVHQHSHSHVHGHHHHSVDLQHINNAFIIGIILNFLFVICETIVGLSIHSLSLLSDAGHNLADVASLALSLLAFRLAKMKSNEIYTYGYKKTTVLVALVNAAILLLSIGAIGYEALHRILAPEPLPGKTISIVAGIGIVINGVTALLFLRNKENDLNIKSAFLHLLADAIVSAGLVIAGILIFYTGYYWLDPVLSIVIAAVILISTWRLLRDSLRLSLDAVPEGINLRHVQSAVQKITGVKDFHHIHIWALSTTENALTAHVVVAKDTDMNQLEKIKHEIKHELLHLNIQHATLEIEMENTNCEGGDC
ncbi:MAG TPA: cation diffusion facilitator family transporter [Puia sp.]|nr:cation diffusion facilitator family transporter [Puia sp.]